MFTGRISGFEPNLIEHIPLQLDNDRVFGTPGRKLHRSPFGWRANVGIRGEENFMRALIKAGILNNFVSFWSLSMPRASSLTPDLRSKADIDCVLVTDGVIFLLDLKYYRSGYVDYVGTNDGKIWCLSGVTGKPMHKPFTLSNVMSRAYQKMVLHGKPYKVFSRVVFMPSNNGVPKSVSVIYPGGIPAVPVDFAIYELGQIPPVNIEQLDMKLVEGLANLC